MSMGTMGNKVNQNMIKHNTIELKELMEIFLGNTIGNTIGNK
jgi:hypothetical protein